MPATNPVVAQEIPSVLIKIGVVGLVEVTIYLPSTLVLPNC